MYNFHNFLEHLPYGEDLLTQHIFVQNKINYDLQQIIIDALLYVLFCSLVFLQSCFVPFADRRCLKNLLKSLKERYCFCASNVNKKWMDRKYQCVWASYGQLYITCPSNKKLC